MAMNYAANITAGMPVLAKDGTQLGTVRETLDDTFVIEGAFGEATIPHDKIAGLNSQSVRLSLSTADLESGTWANDRTT